jgi:hypothetical protein
MRAPRGGRGRTWRRAPRREAMHGVVRRLGGIAAECLNDWIVAPARATVAGDHDHQVAGRRLERPRPGIEGLSFDAARFSQSRPRGGRVALRSLRMPRREGGRHGGAIGGSERPGRGGVSGGAGCGDLGDARWIACARLPDRAVRVRVRRRAPRPKPRLGARSTGYTGEEGYQALAYAAVAVGEAGDAGGPALWERADA